MPKAPKQSTDDDNIVAGDNTRSRLIEFVERIEKNEEEKAQFNSLLDKLSANIDWPDEAERRRHHGCGKHGHEGQGHGCHGHEGHDHCDHHGHHGHHGHHCHQEGSDKD